MIAAAPAEEGRPGEEHRYSRRFSCPSCGRGFQPLVPQSFSFNHQEGMCGVCQGLGTGEGIDREALIPDRGLSIREGAVSLWGPLPKKARFTRLLEAVGTELGFDLDTPYGELPPEGRRAFLYGAGDRPVKAGGAEATYGGLFPTADRFARQIPRYKGLLREVPCSACEGSRLNGDSRAVRLRGTGIAELTRLPIERTVRFFDGLELDERESEVAGELLNEVRIRLRFLERVGLGYVDLGRRAGSLSGGEAQRIRLAGQIGSGLTGVLYLLDEPTIGLHPRDNRRLLAALEELRDLGNTVVLVEHDRDTLEKADHIVDLGPGAGSEGGHLVASGSPRQLARRRRSGNSPTADFLRGSLSIPVPGKRRRSRGGRLRVVGARHNNLKDVDVAFPLGCFVCVTGVSGSGKSSLVEEVLHNGLAAAVNNGVGAVGECDAILGVEHVDKVIGIDQSPIGHSPRSSPATIIGIFDHVRQLFSRLPEARVRGFSPGRFSFNRPGGRCEGCEGLGSRCIEMHFLPDVWVRCDVCQGKRYSSEVLQVRFKGHTVADVLELTASRALELFDNVRNIRNRLQVMADVGIGYMSLGQSSTTFSGGESQRLKLASELSRPDTGRTVYIMDEPTTGLHFADVQKLLEVAQRLVAAGNTLIVIEHNMEVVKSADYVIDLGPEGGEEGGRVVAAGTPEKVARSKRSHTGRILREVLA